MCGTQMFLGLCGADVRRANSPAPGRRAHGLELAVARGLVA